MAEGNGAAPAAFEWSSENLDDLLVGLWALLGTGCREAGHPLHTPVLGTMSNGVPALRTVVLRGVEPEARALVLHTHRGAAKLDQLREQPACQWLFYSAADKVQIQANALASLHHLDDVAQADWAATSLSSRRIYCTVEAPGEAFPPETGPVSGLPPELESRQPTEQESERLGWPNFVVVRTVVTRLEFLYLQASGNRRAAWEWTGAGEGPHASWLVP